MRGQPGLFDIYERLKNRKDLSAKGDELERLNAIIDFLSRRQTREKLPRSNPFISPKPLTQPTTDTPNVALAQNRR